MTSKETSSRQIKQMVNFILQEAHEKVNEIRIKTEHDFNLEKQNLVHNGKIKVQEEYALKEKDLEVQLRISRSASVSAARVKKMRARDDLLEQLKKEVIEKLASFSKTPQYPEYIKKLIVQGLIKIEEQVVEISARAEDKAIVQKVLPDAISEFRSVMTAAGHTVNPKVTISDTPLSSKSTSGGIILSALDGRIVLNQTADERLAIAYYDLMPQVRKGLFPESS
eukprot:CAMPEP_0196763978 /NCGR_PEP_ID=MMETSP1095-20130614/5155_1 /TAXON_ID=96789 ORGANISM="Chromulina nebulosa, Strain UTEXLB2642" /NCGR_SAMPLE_ID=MMETSP1095 /ASSEMBLY_ACC=CAM_ASM_000446 /LENGTH=223 /DNA_ID=CAMNT_0042118407 /DNA_START=43 /DNA_END=714 /DNA_ORIENTATION=-